jgi:hypothetical protein
MTEASLYPAIPYLHAERHHREVMSMSDYVHSDRRSKVPVGSSAIESRLMFVAFYGLFLFRTVITRLIPWRKPASFGSLGKGGSIFKEASSAASVMVASSFMGL